MVLSNRLSSKSGVPNHDVGVCMCVITDLGLTRSAQPDFYSLLCSAGHIISWPGTLQTLPRLAVFAPRKCQVGQFCGLALFVCDVVVTAP